MVFLQVTSSRTVLGRIVGGHESMFGVRPFGRGYVQGELRGSRRSRPGIRGRKHDDLVACPGRSSTACVAPLIYTAFSALRSLAEYSKGDVLHERKPQCHFTWTGKIPMSDMNDRTRTAFATGTTLELRARGSLAGFRSPGRSGAPNVGVRTRHET
jgi:hypothetical protein